MAGTGIEFVMQSRVVREDLTDKKSCLGKAMKELIVKSCRFLREEDSWQRSSIKTLEARSFIQICVKFLDFPSMVPGIGDAAFNRTFFKIPTSWSLHFIMLDVL